MSPWYTRQKTSTPDTQGVEPSKLGIYLMMPHDHLYAEFFFFFFFCCDGTLIGITNSTQLLCCAWTNDLCVCKRERVNVRFVHISIILLFFFNAPIVFGQNLRGSSIYGHKIDMTISQHQLYTTQWLRPELHKISIHIQIEMKHRLIKRLMRFVDVVCVCFCFILKAEGIYHFNLSTIFLSFTIHSIYFTFHISFLMRSISFD